MRQGCLRLLVVTFFASAAWVVQASMAANPLARPLDLPTVAPGAPCPVSKKLIHVPWNGLPLVQGDGPVALMVVPFAPPSAAIDIRGSQPDTLGYVGQKTPWLVHPTYRGPLLIRGREIDGRSPIRFAYGYGDHLTRLYWPRTDQPKNLAHGWFGLPSATLVKRVGCYGFQIDGTSFSEHLIVRVIRK
jgi:hypothetical protein